MKQLFTFLIVVGTIHFGFAQESYLSVGKNFTTYNYTNSLGQSNPNVSPSSGNSYEIGYAFQINDKLRFASAVTLNEFNATGGNFANNYSWSTSYLGLQGVFKYAIYSPYRSSYEIMLNAGLNVNHIINGQQKIDGQTFNLTSEKEFTGVFAQPMLGLDMRYFILNNIALGVGYYYSKSFRVATASDQKLNFSNSQFQFNIIMSLN